jgi:hypothetical protein
VASALAWSWHIRAIAQELEQLPATRRMDGPAEFIAHPASDFRTGPQATVRSRTIQGLLQFGALVGGQERSLARIKVSTIAERIDALLIIAADNRVDPGRGVASDGGHFGAGAALPQKPEDLPVTTRYWLAGLTVPLLYS